MQEVLKMASVLKNDGAWIRKGETRKGIDPKFKDPKNGPLKICTACGLKWYDDGSTHYICPKCHRAKTSLTPEAIEYLNSRDAKS